MPLLKWSKPMVNQPMPFSVKAVLEKQKDCFRELKEIVAADEEGQQIDEVNYK